MTGSPRYRDHVVYDEGAVRDLPAVLDRLDHCRVLLVTGRASFDASGASAMMPELERRFDVERWSDFSANTDSADLAHGLEVVRSFEPDVVVGIGGGSPMDMAKLLVAYDDVPPADLLDTIRTAARVDHRRRGLVLAPTTSGSGSEATHFAVVYIGDDKFSIAGPALRADAVVLDPLLAISGSAHQRATSGVDALCQSIESLWAVAATDESRRYARYGLCLVSRSIRDFVNAPDRSTARAMCLGSHLAGRAIDISKTTAAHALSYGITKRYGIDHGNAVALTLGAFIDIHAAAALHPDRLRPDVRPENHVTAMDAVRSALGPTRDGPVRPRLVTLLDDIGLPSDLAQVGDCSDQSLASLGTSVNLERLQNNPVAITAATLLDVLRTSSTTATR